MRTRVRFTDEARDTVRVAQEEARGLGHQFIGTEHLLLGLLAEPQTAAAQALTARNVRAPEFRNLISPRLDADALAAVGVDLDEVRHAVERFGRGALDDQAGTGTGTQRRLIRRGRSGGHLGLTKRARTVLDLAAQEAEARRDAFIAPDHMLLGLLRHGEGLAAMILAKQQVDFSDLRADVLRRMAAQN
jgi:ATP-dependent Clp protease ATP-binding subunit ClpA